MADESGSDQRCGIGARLRAGREKIGMSVLQAAERMRIDPRMLEALEAERFDVFGAPVYVRGYLRNYAALIGERADELQDLFDEGRRTVLPDLTRAPRAAPVSDVNRPLRLGVFGAATAALVVAVWWVLTRGAQ